jgi:hypothetical protein
MLGRDSDWCYFERVKEQEHTRRILREELQNTLSMLEFCFNAEACEIIKVKYPVKNFVDLAWRI